MPHQEGRTVRAVSSRPLHTHLIQHKWRGGLRPPVRLNNLDDSTCLIKTGEPYGPSVAGPSIPQHLLEFFQSEIELFLGDCERWCNSKRLHPSILTE
jgi:hypothetical protein